MISFEVKYKEDVGGKYFNCHIPKFDIYFSSRIVDEIYGIEKKAKIMAMVWIEFHIEKDKLDAAIDKMA